MTTHTDNFRSRFIEFYYNELQDHPIFHEMNTLAEDSPWHREESIGIHTNMVVAEYISRTPPVWSQVDVVGAMACAFHDFGKPTSMEVVYREDRGEYKRFTGHEKISARIFEDWAASNLDTLSYLGLSPKHIHMIAWLCEYHLPWAIKKDDKRRNLALTALYIERECAKEMSLYNYPHEANILERCLLSDTYGRISDDAETKRNNALLWCAEFSAYKHSLSIDDKDESAPTLYIAIGAPGCGKSRFRQTLPDAVVHNMDELRMKWYATGNTDEDYDAAYLASTKDNKFTSKVHQHFIELMKTGKDIYCDNTNASPKRRRFYVDQAHRREYKVVGVLFPTPLQTLFDRQKTRPDKTVPDFAVRRIWDAVSQPQIGEFDEIRTVV